MIITNTEKNTLPEQVQQNCENIKEIAKHIRNVYKANEEMQTSSSTIEINKTTMPADASNGFLISTNGLLFEIVAVRENLIYVNYWADLASKVQGPQGPQGQRGVGIKDVEITPTSSDTKGITYKVEITLENGEKINAGDFLAVAGKDGENGITPEIEMNVTILNTTNVPKASIVKNGTTQNPVFNLTLNGLKGETGERGPQGLQGPTGPTGAPGPQGEGLKIIGTVDSYDNLLQIQNPKAGDAYFVGITIPRSIYMYDGITNTWKNQGALGVALYRHTIEFQIKTSTITNYKVIFSIITTRSSKYTNVSEIWEELNVENNMELDDHPAYVNNQISGYFYLDNSGTTDFYIIIGLYQDYAGVGGPKMMGFGLTNHQIDFFRLTNSSTSILSDYITQII